VVTTLPSAARSSPAGADARPSTLLSPPSAHYVASDPVLCATANAGSYIKKLQQLADGTVDRQGPPLVGAPRARTPCHAEGHDSKIGASQQGGTVNSV